MMCCVRSTLSFDAHCFLCRTYKLNCSKSCTWFHKLQHDIPFNKNKAKNVNIISVSWWNRYAKTHVRNVLNN